MLHVSPGKRVGDTRLQAKERWLAGASTMPAQDMRQPMDRCEPQTLNPKP
jgi:hypothetical protein